MPQTSFDIVHLTVGYYRDGDTYRGPWRQDHSGKWVGNPATCAEVHDIMKSVKNKVKSSGASRTHSAAMLYPHLERIMRWSESQCPDVDPQLHPSRTLEERTFRTIHYLFRAFLAVGWQTWFR